MKRLRYFPAYLPLTVLISLCGPLWGDSAEAQPKQLPPGAVACIGNDCYRSVEDSLKVVKDGQTIWIVPGSYRDGGVLGAHGVTISAEGVHLFGKAWEGKAAIVIVGNDAVIEGLRCSHIVVPDGNGACIRAEGRNVTLRRVHFHDAECGILTHWRAGRVVIEDSLFERLGGFNDDGGQSHPIYVGAVEEFILRRSRVLSAVGEAHEVKSRAKRTTIEDSVIASMSESDSRLIDIPNGGQIEIRGNVLQEGMLSVNRDIIAVGLERGRGDGLDHELNHVVIENNLILIDRPGRYTFFNAGRGIFEPVMLGNTFVGGKQELTGVGNRWFKDRARAGLEAFPFLPTAPPSLPPK